MKRHRSSESMAALDSICPNSSDDHKGENPEFETMVEGMDDEGYCVKEFCHDSEKKRRLSTDQLRALERNFEFDNKLDPERKVKLAQEVRLEPRQVAVWFQNRRARCKTKRLEKDYISLKVNYDGLRLSVEKLRRDNESLLQELRELKLKLNQQSSKQEETPFGTEEKARLQTPHHTQDDQCGDRAEALDIDNFDELILYMKDGSSESDSSAILNDDTTTTNTSPSAGVSCKSVSLHVLGNACDGYLQQPFMKIDDHNFFEEESCSSLIFSDSQAPTLHWYFEPV